MKPPLPPPPLRPPPTRPAAPRYRIVNRPFPPPAMRRSRTCLALLVLLPTSLLAQSIIGSVNSVQGLVTISDSQTVSTVVPGTPIVDGARLVTSSTGSV